jgi:hypothetical protein
LTSETFITIKAGGPDIPNGTYPVILTAIKGPKTVTAQRGPKAGQDIDLLDWVFAIDAPGNQYDTLEVEATTSTASGPRSKMYGYLTALFNGVAPAVGTNLSRDQLVGRRALATIQKDEEGWLRITNLGALPVSMMQQQFAQATGAPTQANGAPAPTASGPAPLRETVAQTGDLPF